MEQKPADVINMTAAFTRNTWGSITPDQYLKLAMDDFPGTKICWPAIDIMADQETTIVLQQ